MSETIEELTDIEIVAKIKENENIILKLTAQKEGIQKKIKQFERQQQIEELVTLIQGNGDRDT